MRTESATHYGLWELAVLCLLREGPMHPYEMQRLIKERHKDEVLVLKKGSLYHAINRLQRSGLIEVIETGRQGRRPERTTYRISGEGELELVRWLRDIVGTPRPEPSEFMAAVSFLVYLPPPDAVAQLELRAEKLENELAGLTATIKALVARITRINILETEYLLAMRRAELKWVRGVIAELHAGRLTWDLNAIIEAIRAAKETLQTK